MGLPMLRTSLAVLAALLLVGLLFVLIVESRAIKEDYYAAHADRMRAIESSRSDLTAITESAQAAFEQGRQISTSTYCKARKSNCARAKLSMQS